MLPPLPRCSSWVYSSLISPSRISLPRFHCRVGLHIVLFEVCSAFTHVAACTLAQSPYFVTAIRRLQTFRRLHACSGCFRRERIAGWALHPLESAALSRRTPKPAIASPRSWLPRSSGKLRSVPRHLVSKSAFEKRSCRRAGASEDLPRRRENFVRENGILDRAGERQSADNASKGGDGPPTPGGGGAPEETREPLQLSAHVGRGAAANSFASARHVSAQRGQRTAIRAIHEMAFGQVTGNKISDVRISALQLGAVLQGMRHRLGREIFFGCEMPIEAAMGQASLVHDGVKPDAVEPLLPEQARGSCHNPRSVLSCLLACHAHRGPIPPTGIAHRPVIPSRSGGACHRVLPRDVLAELTVGLTTSSAEASNESVEGGREKEAEAGETQHPKQHCCAERLAHFGTGTSGDREGCHTQDERERGHQNWAKPRACGVHGGLTGGYAVFLLLTCKLDNQDRVLSGQADQNDKADLRQDVDRHAPREQSCDRREKAHRHDQDDRQWELPALVLRGQNQKHEESGRTEDENGRGATLLLLKSKVGPFKRNTAGKNVMSKLLHAMQRRASGNTRRRDPLHLGSGEKIVARHAIGNRRILYHCHRPDWHHLAGRVAYLQAGNVLRGTPELPVGLDEDLVSPAEIVEVVHILRTEIYLQRGKHISRREADFFGFHAINIRVDRRGAGIEQGEHAGEVRILVGGVDQGICGAHESLRAEASTVLQHHLEPAHTPEALHWWRRDGQDIGVPHHRQALAQVGQDGVRGHARKLVIVKRWQAGEDRCRIRRHREGRGIEASERRHVLDALCSQNDVDPALDYLLCPVQCRTGRKLNDVDEVALVLLGDKAGWRL